MEKKGLTRAYIAAVIACTTWGFSWFFGKVALEEVNAVQLVAVRFVLACLVFVPWILWRGARIERRHWGLLVLAGVLMVPASFILSFEGLARTTAVNGALIVGSFPPMQALASVVFQGERPGWRGWTAIPVSTLGVVIMVGFSGSGVHLVGDLLILASMVAAVLMVLVTQRLLRHYRSSVLTPWIILVGTVSMMPYAVASGKLSAFHAGTTTWLALVALAIFCTITTFSLWNYSLQYIPGSHAGVLVNLEPFVGAMLGVFLLSDPFSWRTLAGGALILGAATFIAFDRPRKKYALKFPDEVSVGTPA